MQSEYVDAYQEAALNYIPIHSMTVPYLLRPGCLGSILTQPRAVTVKILSRTQDEQGLLQAGKEFGMPLLIINGKEDSINEEVVRAGRI